MVHPKPNGFTLIEFMVVIAIAGVLVAIAVPSLTDVLERRKLSGAGDKLFADLMFAKTEAIKQSSTMRVSFTGNGATWCYGIADDGAACDCTAADCTVDGIVKVTNQSDFPNVSVVADSTLDGDSTAFEPLRGSVAVADTGHLQFSVPSGAQFGAVISITGRVRHCSDSGHFGFNACP